MSQHKQPHAPKGIVTSDVVQGTPHRRLPKKLLFPIIALVVLVILAVAGYGYKVWIYDPAHKKVTTTTQNTQKKDNTYLIHPDKQLTSAQAQLQSAKTSQEKAAAYYAVGAAYLNNKKNAEAIAAFTNCLANDQNNTYKPGALAGLGYAYSRAGQKDKAISTFQDLITFFQQSKDPVVQSRISAYQNVIKQVQAGTAI